MSTTGLHNEVDEIQTLLTQRLRIRGRTLEAQIRKAGRLLPKRIRAEAKYLVQAHLLMQNPKLARMVDARRVDRAHAAVVEHLKAIDPAERRKDIILRTLALWSLYLLLTIGAAVALARWQRLI